MKFRYKKLSRSKKRCAEKNEINPECYTVEKRFLLYPFQDVLLSSLKRFSFQQKTTHQWPPSKGRGGARRELRLDCRIVGEQKNLMKPVSMKTRTVLKELRCGATMSFVVKIVEGKAASRKTIVGIS